MKERAARGHEHRNWTEQEGFTSYDLNEVLTSPPNRGKFRACGERGRCVIVREGMELYGSPRWWLQIARSSSKLRRTISSVFPASTIHAHWLPVNETLISPSWNAARTTHNKHSVLPSAMMLEGMIGSPAGALRFTGVRL